MGANNKPAAAKKTSASSSAISQLLSLAVFMGAPASTIDYLVQTHHADVNERFDFMPGASPLIIAIQNRSASVALRLVELGANVNFQDDKKNTPLLLSCEMADFLPVTRALVEWGSKVDYHIPARHKPRALCTALGMCILQRQPLFVRGEKEGSPGLKQARVLLDAGASPDLCFDAQMERPPYMFAIAMQDVRMLKLLLRYAPDMRKFSHYGLTWFEGMADGTISNISEDVLVHFPDMFAARDFALKPVGKHVAITLAPMFALFYSQPVLYPRVVQRWIELGADTNMALQHAASKGRVEDIRLFLQAGQAGADPNFLNQPLVKAALKCENKEHAKQVAHELVRAGADVKGVCGVVMDMEVMMVLATPGRARALLEPLLKDFEEEEEGGGGVEFTFCAYCRRRGGGEEVVFQPCSGCVMVAYCNEQYQRAHWKEQHKVTCKKKREMQERRRSGAGAMEEL